MFLSRKFKIESWIYPSHRKGSLLLTTLKTMSADNVDDHVLFINYRQTAVNNTKLSRTMSMTTNYIFVYVNSSKSFMVSDDVGDHVLFITSRQTADNASDHVLFVT